MTSQQNAQQMLDQIKTGKTVFTRGDGRWMVIGPADTIATGATVEVTKRDGTTEQVVITQLGAAGDKQGCRYQVAHFRKTTTPAPRARTGYTEVHSDTYGRGRRYRSQPGATQYDDGTGTYSVQIWDHA